MISLAWLPGMLAGGFPGLAGRFAGLAEGVPGRLAGLAGREADKWCKTKLFMSQ